MEEQHSSTKMEHQNIQRRLGERLKLARKKSRMTQDDVACCLGVTRQTVSAWERGAACLSTPQLALLSQAYCACAHELLFGEGHAALTAQAHASVELGRIRSRQPKAA